VAQGESFVAGAATGDEDASRRIRWLPHGIDPFHGCQSPLGPKRLALSDRGVWELLVKLLDLSRNVHVVLAGTVFSVLTMQTSSTFWR
jgi:hypothetical protein